MARGHWPRRAKQSRILDKPGAAPFTVKFEPGSVWKTAFSPVALVNQSRAPRRDGRAR